MGKKFDFGGYATRFNVRCTDGRTIKEGAFAHCDGECVPIVWQHRHNDPLNVLGKGYLENRKDGVYVWGLFNDTKSGQHAKAIVEHGDIDKLSIFANHVEEQNGDVLHGNIKEVSLVYSGANYGAFIDTVSFAHDDGSPSGEVVIYSSDSVETDIEHADTEDEEMDNGTKKKTVGEIIETMNEEQKNALNICVAEAFAQARKPSDDEGDKNEVTHSDGGNEMVYNAFERDTEGGTLSHAEVAFAEDMPNVFEDAKRCGSLKQAVIAHAATYGIDNIDYLFPEAKEVIGPTTIDRDQSWVSVFMDRTHKTPFQKVKSVHFDITADEARARGYIKGNKKADEVINTLRRETDAQMVYKRQRLDREDLITIEGSGLSIVPYLKNEMKGKMNEELARAALVGDGRSVDSPDKIKEDRIRPIYTDNDLYSVKVAIPVSSADTASTKAENIIDSVIRSRKLYKGTGNPIWFTTDDILADLLLLKDTTGHYLYKSPAELATVLRVSQIVTVPVMEGVSREITDGGKTYTMELAGIMVNPGDYNFGSNPGGKIDMFDDFDIDYNQYKYLIEGMYSGALIRPYSAIVLEFKSEKAAG